MYRVEIYVPMFDQSRNEFDREKWFGVESLLMDFCGGFTALQGLGCYISPDGALCREPVIIYRVENGDSMRLNKLIQLISPYITEAFDQEIVKIDFYELLAPAMYCYISDNFVEPQKFPFGVNKDEG